LVSYNLLCTPQVVSPLQHAPATVLLQEPFPLQSPPTVHLITSVEHFDSVFRLPSQSHRTAACTPLPGPVSLPISKPGLTLVFLALSKPPPTDFLIVRVLHMFKFMALLSLPFLVFIPSVYHSFVYPPPTTLDVIGREQRAQPNCLVTYASNCGDPLSHFMRSMPTASIFSPIAYIPSRFQLLCSDTWYTSGMVSYSSWDYLTPISPATLSFPTTLITPRFQLLCSDAWYNSGMVPYSPWVYISCLSPNPLHRYRSDTPAHSVPSTFSYAFYTSFRPFITIDATPDPPAIPVPDILSPLPGPTSTRARYVGLPY
jgi:hypothetical protein